MAEGTLGGTKIADLPASSFAYCEPGTEAVSTRCHFPIRDANGKPDPAHVRNALARLSGSPFEAKARGKVEAAAKELGIGQQGKAEPLDPDELSAWLAGKRSRAILSIPFGGPIPNPLYAKGKDIDDEWFSERTDIKPNWFDVRPVTWHHGDDAVMGNEPFGKAQDLTLDEVGWWSQVWLDAGDRRLKYIEDIVRKLAAKGRDLFGSSAPIGRFVKTAKSGEILVWPHAEQTFSTSPQNTRSVLLPAKAIADFDAAGISISDPLRAILVDLDVLGTELRQNSDGLYLPDPGDDAAKSGRVISTKNESAIRARLRELNALIDEMVGLYEEKEL